MRDDPPPPREHLRHTASTIVEGLFDPDRSATERLAPALGSYPIVRFLGIRSLHPLFGTYCGAAQVHWFLREFHQQVEVRTLRPLLTIEDGGSISAHYRAEWLMKASGAVLDLELVVFIHPDSTGRARSVHVYLDTAAFLRATTASSGELVRDLRLSRPAPPFQPDSELDAGALVAEGYDAFAKILMQPPGEIDWDLLLSKFSEDVEIVLKSNPEVIPYAGTYHGHEGLQQWLAALFSVWRLNAYDFTEAIAQGNHVDFAMHERHYLIDSERTPRFVDVYLVHSFRLDDDGRVRTMVSTHDSAWLEQAMTKSVAYLQHYALPGASPIP